MAVRRSELVCQVYWMLLNCNFLFVITVPVEFCILEAQKDTCNFHRIAPGKTRGVLTFFFFFFFFFFFCRRTIQFEKTTVNSTQGFWCNARQGRSKVKQPLKDKNRDAATQKRLRREEWKRGKCCGPSNKSKFWSFLFTWPWMWVTQQQDMTLNLISLKVTKWCSSRKHDVRVVCKQTIHVYTTKWFDPPKKRDRFKIMCSSPKRQI